MTYRLRNNGSDGLATRDVISDKKEVFCQVSHYPGEFGVYQLPVGDDGISCSLQTLLEPVNIYLPLLLCLIFFVGLALLMLGLKKVLRWKRSRGSLLEEQDGGVISQEEVSYSHSPLISTQVSSTSEENSEEEGIETVRRGSDVKSDPPDETHKRVKNQNEQGTSTSSIPSAALVSENALPGQQKKERIRSIDAFRGLAIIIMIFVDDGGGSYYFFQHCTWDGLYVADLAFPWFLWIMGTCIPISIEHQRTRGIPHSSIMKSIILRSIKLFLLGLFIINTSGKPEPPQLGNLRIPGVLQRFGICYLIVSAVYLYGHFRGQQEEEENLVSLTHFDRVKRSLKGWTSWIIVLSIVGVHTSIIFLLPVPGCPTGYLGPAGLHLNASYPPECIGGATGYVDRLLLGKDHIYQYPTAKPVYNSGPFDPEGSLGILPCIFHVWLGLQAGLILTSDKPNPYPRLLGFSILLGSLTLGLTLPGLIPLNKNLWSLSYVLLTSSLGFLILTCLHWVIDVKHLWNGTPLVETGMNSILLYAGHEVLEAALPWHFRTGRMNTHFINLIENLWGMGVWVGVALWLHMKNMFFVV